MSKATNLIEPQVLLVLFDYDEATGELTWKVDFGTRRRGDKVGGKSTYKRRPGDCGRTYLHAKLGGKSYRVQNLIWTMKTGRFPCGEVDHKDRNPQNNRFENLRDASRSDNQANTSLYQNNKSGIRGVHKNGLYWRAMISKGGVNRHLGYFVYREQAEHAWRMAASEAHGEFAAL